MKNTNELNKIKKIYGEKFMQLCRDLFPIILEQEGKMLEILEKRFSHNCNSLYETIIDNGLEIEFKNLIYDEFDESRVKEKVQKEETRTPYEILDEAGYNLYECTSEKEIKKFKKYYAQNEVLCTIYNGGRLNTDVCFWAVKKNVDEIKRENFKKPKKDDEYSLSVLAIQFDKLKYSDVQIISRYNHSVINPNCTLNNDLNLLAPGLEESFRKVLIERGYYLSSADNRAFEMPGYTLANDGKYYKYNMEIDGTYYCPGNIIIHQGEVKRIGKPGETILADYFEINLKEKTIKMAENCIYHDSFIDDLNNINKIEVRKSEDKKTRTIIINKADSKEPIEIKINSDNEIIGYTNKELTKAGDFFLFCNKRIKELILPQLKKAGEEFLCRNNSIKNLSLPLLIEVGNSFFNYNNSIINLNLPKLKKTGNRFFSSNCTLKELNLPNLIELGKYSFYFNDSITKLNLPKAKKMGDYCLTFNEEIESGDLSQLTDIGEDSLSSLNALTMARLQQKGKGHFFTFKQIIKNALRRGVTINDVENVESVERDEMQEEQDKDLGG